MKPDHVKKNVRPYLSSGFKIGILRALRFNRLTSGADHRWETLKGMIRLSLVVLEVYLSKIFPARRSE